MNVIEYADALRALNHAVALKGYNFVYQRPEEESACWNVWKGEAHCIVGHALVFLGVPVEWFDQNSVARSTAEDVCELLNAQSHMPLEFTHAALVLFMSVQGNQDNGMPWGEAVTREHLTDDEWYEFALDQDVPV